MRKGDLNMEETKKGDLSMEETRKTAQTPEETNQAVSDLTDRVAKMDKAEGVFGESLLDEELDDVAGGYWVPGAGVTRPPLRCPHCGAYGPHDCPYGKNQRS